MKVYVINLPSETERLSLFQAGYPSCLPTPTVYRALSGEEVTPPASWKTSKNRYALVLNFLDILKSSLNSDEPLMICEDDAVFSDDFEEQFNTFMQNVPADYDMLFLGGLHFDTVLAEPVKVNDTTLRCKATLLTHCVIYNPASLQKIIDCLEAQPWECIHAQDWRYVQMMLRPEWNVYSPLKFLSAQRGGLLSSLDNVVRCSNAWNNDFKYYDPVNKVHMPAGMLYEEEENV